jgi:hypothetical protein
MLLHAGLALRAFRQDKKLMQLSESQASCVTQQKQKTSSQQERNNCAQHMSLGCISKFQEGFLVPIFA